jgi:AcrR family transcriptional regulator
MPRAIGQIDPKKSEAILEAAQALFSERGLNVSMAEIARQAGVSKQTLYNRFPSKTEIGQALARLRSDAITAPLREPGDPLHVLAGFARIMIQRISLPEKGASLRSVVLMSAEAPDVARAVFEGGPAESIRRLSAWLAEQNAQGRLVVRDPDAAAEMFSGMVLGHSHLRHVMGVPQPPFDIEAKARDAAIRFIRAFSA